MKQGCAGEGMTWAATVTRAACTASTHTGCSGAPGLSLGHTSQLMTEEDIAQLSMRDNSGSGKPQLSMRWEGRGSLPAAAVHPHHPNNYIRASPA